MKRTVIAIVMTLATLSLTHAVAQEREVLFMEDFEGGVGSSVTLDPAAELSVTNDPDLVFAGEGSLQLEYVQAPMYQDVPDWGLPGSLALPLPEGLAGLGEVAFALRAQLSTPIVVTLAEGDDGPRYNCLLWCAADEWSEFSLALDDFVSDLDGPVDPNGRLDLELVNGIALIDADSFVRAIAEQSPLFDAEPAAEQTLWLDEFVLRAGEPPAAMPEVPAPLAHYTPPMRGFLVIGGRDVTVASEEQDDGAYALRLGYTMPATTILGLMNAIQPDALADCSAIRLHARTNRQVTLIVALEEQREPGDLGKSRYESVVTLEPSEDLQTITLPLALFKLADDQTDPDGALNADLVNMLSIADVTAIFTGGEVINTLRLLPPVAVD